MSQGFEVYELLIKSKTELNSLKKLRNLIVRSCEQKRFADVKLKYKPPIQRVFHENV